MNSAIGFKASKATNLYEFYTIFNRTVQRWRSREHAAEFECSKVIPTSCIPLIGILKHAYEVYTLSVFTDFEDELLKSILSTVSVLGEQFEVRVYDVQNHDDSSTHRVSFFHGQNFISCTCRRFEEYGLLCSHSLKILDRNSVQQIPIRYIMKRWTKYAKKDLWDKVANSGDRIAETITSNSWRHKMARQYYNVLIKVQESEDARMIIEEGSKKIFEAVEEFNITEALIQDTDVSSSYMTVLDPSKTTTKGRKKRIKGQLEKAERRRQLTHQIQFS